MLWIKKEAGIEPEEIDIHDGQNLLHAAQWIIGGVLQEVRLDGNVVCLCDDNGIDKHLPDNCGLVGTLVFVGAGWTGLTEEQKQIVYGWVNEKERRV